MIAGPLPIQTIEKPSRATLPYAESHTTQATTPDTSSSKSRPLTVMDRGVERVHRSSSDSSVGEDVVDHNTTADKIQEQNGSSACDRAPTNTKPTSEDSSTLFLLSSSQIADKPTTKQTTSMCRESSSTSTLAIGTVSNPTTEVEDKNSNVNYVCEGSWILISNDNIKSEHDSKEDEEESKEKHEEQHEEDSLLLKSQSLLVGKAQASRESADRICNGESTALVLYKPESDVLGIEGLNSTSTPAANLPIQRYKGIQNLGNTCYMSSALQMLMSVDGFVQEIVESYRQDQCEKEEEKKCDDDQMEEERRSFPIRDSLAKIFISSQTEHKAGSINPNAFKDVIDEKTSLFLGYRQQDSHEFFSTLIDLLHDEMKKSNDDSKTKSSDESKSTSVDEHDASVTSDKDDASSTGGGGGIAKVPSYSELNVEAINVLLHGKNATNVKPEPKKRRGMFRSWASVASGRGRLGKTTDEDEESHAETASTPLTPISPCETSFNCCSPVDTYFTTEIKIQLTCDSCNYTRSHKEVHRYLSLEVDESMDHEYSIEEGLRRYFVPEKRETKCEKCFCETSTQSMQVTRLPRCLVLHLKRFIVDVSPDYSQINYRKNSKAIDIQNELSLNTNDHHNIYEYLSKDVKFPLQTSDDCVDEIVYVDINNTTDDTVMISKYKIRSIINHLGASANRGHYTADALKVYDDTTDSVDDKPESNVSWTRFNDSFVSRINPEKAVEGQAQKTAYMIAYEFTR